VGRTALSKTDEEAFRCAMRDAATRRFAKYGEAGVTMRGLAEDLGCSPMTPYRYVRDREEIFDMVRAAAIESFVEAQERAFATEHEPLRRLRALGRAYLDHAVTHPDRYRVMFQLQRERRPSRELIALDIRGWTPMRKTIGAAIESGELIGDPDELAHVFWCALHGLAMLHLAGKLRLGRDLASLTEPVFDLMLAGAGAGGSPKRKRAR
jgi:AcrR family transcriptional regulator